MAEREQIFFFCAYISKQYTYSENEKPRDILYWYSNLNNVPKRLPILNDSVKELITEVNQKRAEPFFRVQMIILFQYLA